ncbi:MAG: PSD1 domain-containing protein [Planctomycetes bacterium]|nr:PSD1 domain-containing protein [Planctomycetota bacterium]
MRSSLVFGCLFLGTVLSPAGDAPKSGPRSLPAASPGTVDFQRDIKPILAKTCLTCHGPEKQRGGLRLDSRKAALEGGNSGPVLKPGDAASSRLLFIVAGLDADLQMPPKGRTPLTPREVGLLRAWVDQGLKWTDEGTVATQSRKADHWAFRAPKRPPPPTVRNAAWVHNDLDRFILARLEKEGLSPSPEADRATLIRRLSLDLLGLPPTPAEVDAFVRDPRPDAYEHLVDRLLASPHYGERWARHWLDLARYADSDGYEKDTGRPFAWRWRDWVINALNRDLPYDEFVIEQLAGDLLPKATRDQKVATGFHRNTLTNREGGVDQEQYRVEAVVDRVNTTAKVLLGITLGCAQCHDHKYDPFSQREYYQFFAFFDRDVEANLPMPTPADLEVHAKQKAAQDGRRKPLAAALEEYRRQGFPAALRKWEQGLKPADRTALPAKVRQSLVIDEAKRTAAQQKLVADHFAKLDPKLLKLTQVLAAHDKAGPQLPMAQTLALGPPRKTHVLMRGDFLRKGAEVWPGVPALFPPLHARSAPTRLELARWIASPENPLTARVLVNWVWHKYFGRGIVATLEDFGTQGERPSHPELLDWLATAFMRPASGGVNPSRWSLKTLHRLLVTSATYRQSSKVRPELLQRDPLNVLLARQGRHRLEAELVRDAALSVSGLLVRYVGGPSVRPPQPPGISELSYAGSVRWVESSGADRYRRGLYIWFQRTSPYPMLMTFDAPDSNVCCVRREKSNTPLQALTLLNDTVFVECAQRLGRRVVEEMSKAATEQRVQHAFRVCLGRAPSEAETKRLILLYDDLLALAKANPDAADRLTGKTRPVGVPVAEAAAWVALARALMNLDEFVTRE